MSPIPFVGRPPGGEQLAAVLGDLPEGPLKRRLDAFLGELARLVGHPGCPEMQADGVPCPTATASCEECQQVAELVDMLRAVVKRD
jgi:hypothetical protein